MRQRVVVIIILIMLSLLWVQLVSAATPYEIFVEDVTTSIFPGAAATFSLSILNNLEIEDEYSMQLEGLSWNVQSDPLADYLSGIKLDSKSSHSTVLKLAPIETLEFGIYRLELKITSKNSKLTKSVFLNVNVKNPQPPIREYFAVVSRLVEVPPLIDPREPVVIKINLENRNPKNITSLQIKLSSNLINAEQATNLGPLKKRAVQFDIELDPLTPPQEDILKVTLIVDNNVLEPEIREPITIIEYSNVVEKIESPVSGFLSNTQSYTFTNKGNINAKHTTEKRVGFFAQLFTSTTPKAYKISKSEGNYLAWDIELGPNESKTISKTASYLPLFILGLIIIIIIAAYFIFRSPMALSKDATIIATKQGGISQLKIVIHLKNRTPKNFEDVTVIDKVPNIVEIEKHPEHGAIQPTRILRSTKEGSIIKYELGTLERFEERIVTYRVKSKLTIIGGMNLPNAMVKFSTKNGKEQISKSNRLDITM